MPKKWHVTPASHSSTLCPRGMNYVFGLNKDFILTPIRGCHKCYTVSVAQSQLAFLGFVKCK